MRGPIHFLFDRGDQNGESEKNDLEEAADCFCIGIYAAGGGAVC